MIYFTTLIFALLFSHVARAMPACDGAVAAPATEELFDPTYDAAFDDAAFDDGQGIASYKVTWDAKYDNPNGNTNSVACSNGPNGLSPRYPYFHNFPHFPYIGGAFNVRWGSPNCGKCWKLTYKNNYIYLTAIDAASPGFNIAKRAFIALGGSISAGTLNADAVPVAPRYCGL